MPFVHLHDTTRRANPGDITIALSTGRVLAATHSGDGIRLPTLERVATLAPGAAPFFIGTLDGRALWLLHVEATPAAPEGWAWHEVKPLVPTLPRETMQALACALQLDWWLGRGRFCGHCGAPTEVNAADCSLRCPKCGALFYPTPSPAVIVAVTRGDKLLLAHNKNFPAVRFSVIAGFVDPGESLEQAVAREVREEVGLEVRAIRYVRSQPWPFPNSLMAAFRAECPAGDIRCDGVEIETAGWYPPDALPDIPNTGTVARELIEDWRNNR